MQHKLTAAAIPQPTAPSLEDTNAWVDHWYYVVGVNLVPAKTQAKKVFVPWSEWQVRPLPEEKLKEWKHNDAFRDGVAIIVGKVWRGDHKGEYLIFVDCDNSLAIDELCTSPSGEKTTLENLAKNFIVEQHPDDKSKAHIYFYSKVPFVKKSTDIVAALETKEEEDGSDIPAIEIKGDGTHGLAYCTPSYHKNGHRYQIIGNLLPTISVFDERNARVLMEHINKICKRYGLRYLELDTNGNGKALTPMADLFKEDFVIPEKHNRHGALMRVIESLIKRTAGIMSLEEIEDFTRKWNEKHCRPPLDDREFRKQWNAATKWIQQKIREEQEEQKQQDPEEQPQPQQQQEQQQEMPPAELAQEVDWDFIANILNVSIKKDKAAKLIDFCGFLLAQTNEDQINIGFQAESSAGKSYIPLELAAYFPVGEIMIIAHASPTAFFHDSGTWDPDRKALLVDLERKNVILLDMPHFMLAEKLRPLMSHDRKELIYKITDKSQKQGLRTKNVILRGYSSMHFCSANMNADEQEKTRMIMVSPSSDEEKLRDTLKLAALKKADTEAYKQEITQNKDRQWLIQRIYHIRQWGIRDVIIPDKGVQVYDRFITEHPHLIARHNRDLPRIFSFIKAHALLNCFNRTKKEGKNDTIIASKADIDAGFDLYHEIGEANELGLSPYMYSFYKDVIKPLLDSKIEGVDSDNGGVSREEILKKFYAIKHKSIHPSMLKDMLLQIEAEGLILTKPDPADKRRILICKP